MQRSISPSSTTVKSIFRHMIQPANKPLQKPCEVFINHRGIDTKKNIAGLLYHHLRALKLQPFLDSKSMKPGDKLFDKIDAAIRECKVGVAVFSPSYCDSYFCMHELSLMMELKKKVVPIFCDVKPSELRVKDYLGHCGEDELVKFRGALDEARNTVGLTFDTSKGDWSEFLSNATEVVIKNMIEVEEEEEEKEIITKNKSYKIGSGMTSILTNDYML